LQIKSHEEILQLIKEIEELEHRINEESLEDMESGIDTTTEPIGEVPSVDSAEILINADSPIATKKKLRFTLHRKPRRRESFEKTAFHSFLHPEPVRNVFTLRLNDAGELVGFDLKKPTPPREKIQLRTIFKRKTPKSESATIEEPTPGLKGKLLRITRIFKRPNMRGEEGSKASGVIGKIKGIFSRS
jgi:hypothetical protein